MAFGKMVFYDWAGANVELFKAINGSNDSYFHNMIMLMVSKLAESRNFPYYFVLFIFCGFLDFSLRKLKGRGGANHSLVAWFGVLLVFAAAFMLNSGMINAIKKHTEFPRPYVVLAPEDLTLLEYKDDRVDDYRSFPSGHVAFVTVMLTALWPVLSQGMRKTGMGVVLLVCWSRIAVGLHFPADAFYAIVISLIITFLVRWFVYLQLLRFNLKC